MLLTGDAGTGKTVLINGLLRSTRVKAIIANIPDPDLEILEFFNFLSEEFQMKKLLQRIEGRQRQIRKNWMK